MRVNPRAWLLIAACFIAQPGNAQDTHDKASKASSTAALKLEVIDPYLDVHTGPGRGYPVFYVVEQGENVEILTRRPDWYEIKTRRGKTGWVRASQIARTLQPTGEPVDLPTVSYGDFLKNSWRVGMAAGRITGGKEIDDGDMFGANVGYRPLSWVSFDIEFGNFYTPERLGDFYNFNIVLEPFSKWKASPVVFYGQGSMNITLRPKTPAEDIDDSSYDVYGLGVHYYIGRSFVLRGEFRQYSVDIKPNAEDLNSWSVGFNTFF